MRFFKFLALSALLMSAFSISAFAQVTVSGSTGANAVYTELNLAFTAINGAGTQAGNNILVSISANTTETASATLNASDWATLTVRPTATVTVTGNIVGGVIKLNGADNVTIDGRIGGVGTARSLTVSNSSTSAATAAIWLASVIAGNGASNNVIRNLEIAAGATQNTSTTVTHGIIQTGTTISLTATDGNDNDNNQFIFNRVIRARHAISSRGVTSNNNLNPVITDNIIGPSSFGADEIGASGIYMQADTGAVVSRNTVQFVGGDLANTTAGADRCGICIGTNGWSATATTTITSGDYTVTRNVIHDVIEERTFSAMGIVLGTTRSGVATNNLIANNFIYNVRANGTGGDQVVGIGITGGHTDSIVNNSISITGDVDPGAAAATTQYGNGIRITTANGTNNVNFTVMNNSIYLDASSSSTAANRYYAITINSTAAYVFGTGGLNFNNYYINPANTQLQTGGLGTGTNTTATQFATLANWQAALTAPQDAASIQANPLHASPTADLHLTGASPNINTGTTIAAVTVDIDNEARPNGANYDIGADEFYPAPGVLQLSSATYGGNEGTTLVATVNRVSGTSGIVGVTYTLTNGSGTGGAACGVGVDFVNPGPTLLSFGDSVGSQPINVTLCTDAVVDPAETFTITLSAATGGASLGTPTVATATITDVPPPFSGPYTVGTAGTYPSLTNAGGIFEAINLAGATGPVTINITSDLTGELGTNALNPVGGGFAVTIQPSGGAARQIIGSNSTTALIDFNGADNITVDGLNTGGNSLLIRNTGTTPTVRYINDASTHILRNSTIEGASTSSVVFVSTGTTTGNDVIQILNNTIRDRSDAAGVPFNAVNLVGSNITGNTNSNTTLSNNQITNFTNIGILVGNSENVTISGNTVSQTAARTTALTGIGTNTPVIGTNTITQNVIRNLTTTLGVTGMSLGDWRATTVSRNHIHSFQSTSGSTGTLTGIIFTGSSTGASNVTVVNNMVSIVPAFTNAQITRGILDFGFTGNTFTAFYNTVLLDGTASGATNSFACGRLFSAPTAFTFQNNLCFNNRTGGTGNHFAMSDQSAATGTFVSNFNMFVGTGATAANFFDYGISTTGTPVTYAAWQTGPPARDASSIQSNPGMGSFTVGATFINQVNLHTNITSPGRNVGTLIPGVTIDFDGQTRPNPGDAFSSLVVQEDIGADEFYIPTAANVSLRGRVRTTSGNPLRNVKLTISGGNLTEPRIVTTGSLGIYEFEDLLVGETYIVTVQSKRFIITEPIRVISLNGAVEDFDFTALEP